MIDDEDKRNIAIQRLRSGEAERSIDETDERARKLAGEVEKRIERSKKLGVEGTGRSRSSREHRHIDSAGPSLPTEHLDEYDALTEDNERWVAQRGIQSLELDDLLDPDELREIESWDPLGRERWSPDDFLTVGACAAIGLIATVFDDQIDAVTKSALSGLGGTSVMRKLENRGKNLPIDYTGPGFGGKGHRMRSAGHDIGRPWAALKQIMDGEFHGIAWDSGVMQDVVKTSSRPGSAPFLPQSLPEALVSWMCHLGADVVTPMSLPLPWWSKLYESPHRDLRKLAANLYDPVDAGTGLNMRSAFLSKSIPVAANEVVVRTKVHLDRYSQRGTFGSLSENTKLRRDEMLLAAQGALGASALGKTAVVLVATKNPLGIRHLNAPALARTGFLGFKVVREYRRRRADRSIPSWDALLIEGANPWELPVVNSL